MLTGTSDDKDSYDQNVLLSLLLLWDSSVKLTVHKNYILFYIYKYATLRPYLGVVYSFFCVGTMWWFTDSKRGWGVPYVKLCALYCAVRCRGAQSETRCYPTVCPILHPGMSRGPGSTQNHGLPDDTYTSSEYSTDSEDSLSLTKLSSDEEEIKDQGSKVSNARPPIKMCLVHPFHNHVGPLWACRRWVRSSWRTKASHSEGWVQLCCLSVRVGSHHLYVETWCWHVASFTTITLTTANVSLCVYTVGGIHMSHKYIA